MLLYKVKFILNDEQHEDYSVETIQFALTTSINILKLKAAI